MKVRTHSKILYQLVLLITLGSLVDPLVAQTFTTLHSFASGNPINVPDAGASPFGGLVLSGNTLYGTAAGNVWRGDWGTVFAIKTDGTEFRTLHAFSDYLTTSRGAIPYAGLSLSGHTLFGTTQRGGAGGNGTVFAIENDGKALTNLYSFEGTNGGASPQAGLILSGDTVYGTAQYGGSSGDGTVFALKTDGTAFRNLHSFVYDDGAQPIAGLLLSGDTLYGTTVGGGGSGNGTVYAIKSDGTGFTNLYFFTATQRSSYLLTNSDGANPSGGLVLLGDTLFGTTTNGGISGNGTVFALKTNGTGFTNLYVFTATHSGSAGSLTNSDGARPCAGLVLSGDTLYGTAQYGGIAGKGTVFALKIDGTGFTNLHNFTATISGRNSDGVDVWAINNDGANPYAGLILSGNTLYGVASRGGSWGNGTVFSLTVPRPPQLTIIPSGANVILTWPTSTTGFVLQSASDLASPVAWTTVFPAPTLIGGQNIVINPSTEAQHFFRLSQ